MDVFKQLEWIQRNRSPRSRTTHVAAALIELAGRLADEAEPAEAAADRLAELVDEDFRRHCRVGRLTGGVLTLCVDEPALISVFRMQWGPRIRRELPKLLGRGISRVIFTPGRGGTPIGPRTFSN